MAAKPVDLTHVLEQYQCVSVRIDITKNLPVTVSKEYQIGKKSIVANLEDIINAEELTIILTRIDELVMAGSGSLRVNCRFVPDNKPYLICCELRSEKRMGRTIDFLHGVIMDVAEFNKSMESDPAQQELTRKNLNKFSAAGVKRGDIGIAAIVGKKELIRIQQPFSDEKGLCSALLTDEKEFICSCDINQKEFDYSKYKYYNEINIRVSDQVYAIWVLASNDKALLQKYSRIHIVLSDNLSKLSGSYVLLYNEMTNTRQANKLLSETIEQQMLLNDIYSRVLNERNSESTVEAVVKLTGEFLKLGRIVIYEDFPDNEKYKLVYEWGEAQSESASETSEISEFNYSDYSKLLDELGYYDTYFSSDPTHDVLGLEFTSYIASNLNGDGFKYGIIIFLVNDVERVLTHSEKRLLRSVSQIITAVIMRCRDNRQLEERNERLQTLAFYDHILGVKNKASLDNDVAAALESGLSGALVAFKLPNVESIDNFAGYGRSNEILTKVLERISSYSKSFAEPYRYSDSIFMVLLRDINLNDVNEFCKTLTSWFDQPWSFGGGEHYLEIIAGVSTYPAVGATPEKLYISAAMSMEKVGEYGCTGSAQSLNSYGFAFQSQEGDCFKNDEYSCGHILMKAIENNMEGLNVRYLPVYSTKETDDSKLIAYEAQVTLNTNISSRMIMRIAEKTGVDVAVDSWVLKQACQFCREARLQKPDITVAVQVCERSLTSGKIVESVENALALDATSQARLEPFEPSAIMLSFSERIIAANYDKFISVLGSLSKIGVKVILDDFGSYYTVWDLFRHSAITAIKADITLFTCKPNEYGERYIDCILRDAKNNNVSIGVKSVLDKEQLNQESVQDVDWYQES